MSGILQSKDLRLPIHTGDIKYLGSNFPPKAVRAFQPQLHHFAKKHERIFHTLDQTANFLQIVQRGKINSRQHFSEKKMTSSIMVHAFLQQLQRTISVCTSTLFRFT